MEVRNDPRLLKQFEFQTKLFRLRTTPSLLKLSKARYSSQSPLILSQQPFSSSTRQPLIIGGFDSPSLLENSKWRFEMTRDFSNSSNYNSPSLLEKLSGGFQQPESPRNVDIWGHPNTTSEVTRISHLRSSENHTWGRLNTMPSTRSSTSSFGHLASLNDFGQRK